eukprot:PhF_6_TR15086/c0_g1_i2/m.23732
MGCCSSTDARHPSVKPERPVPTPQYAQQMLLSLRSAIDRTAIKIQLPPTWTSLCRYSIFPQQVIADVDVLNIFRALTSSPSPPSSDKKGDRVAIELDRAVGALLGLAMGDSAGHPLEFVNVVDPRRTPETTPRAIPSPTIGFQYQNEFNRFRLLPGQWTDDTSMALCLADSLLVHNGGYNGGDVRVRFHTWWHHGYNNTYRFARSVSNSIGLGGNIRKSLMAMDHLEGKRYSVVPEVVEGEGEDAGNGSLMRLVPIPIRYHKDITKAMEIAARHSLSTHPGTSAAECCRFLTYFVIRAIKRSEDKPPTSLEAVRSFMVTVVDEFLAGNVIKDPPENIGQKLLLSLLRSTPPSDAEAVWNWKTEGDLDLATTLRARGPKYNGYDVDPGYFGSYCLDGLAMALWSLYHSSIYVECITKVINLLGDADTTGAIAGQMAGALYGYQSIRQDIVGEKLIQNLRQWDQNNEMMLRAMLLYLEE